MRYWNFHTKFLQNCSNSPLRISFRTLLYSTFTQHLHGTFHGCSCALLGSKMATLYSCFLTSCYYSILPLLPSPHTHKRKNGVHCCGIPAAGANKYWLPAQFTLSNTRVHIHFTFFLFCCFWLLFSYSHVPPFPS